MSITNWCRSHCNLIGQWHWGAPRSGSRRAVGTGTRAHSWRRGKRKCSCRRRKRRTLKQILPEGLSRSFCSSASLKTWTPKHEKVFIQRERYSGCSVCSYAKWCWNKQPWTYFWREGTLSRRACWVFSRCSRTSTVTVAECICVIFTYICFLLFLYYYFYSDTTYLTNVCVSLVIRDEIKCPVRDRRWHWYESYSQTHWDLPLNSMTRGWSTWLLLGFSQT